MQAPQKFVIKSVRQEKCEYSDNWQFEQTANSVWFKQQNEQKQGIDQHANDCEPVGKAENTAKITAKVEIPSSEDRETPNSVAGKQIGRQGFPNSAEENNPAKEHHIQKRGAQNNSGSERMEQSDDSNQKHGIPRSVIFQKSVWEQWNVQPERHSKQMNI